MDEFYLPEKASNLAEQTDSIFNFINAVNAFFFAAIVILMCYFVVKYRRKSEDEVTPHITHNLALEIVWSVIPIILVMFMFYWGYKAFGEMRNANNLDKDRVDLYVTGKQFGWNFKYGSNGTVVYNDLSRKESVPAKMDGKKVIEDAAPILTLPVNRQVHLIMTSKDVLHSFAVPAFRIKQDVIKNQSRSLVFTPIKEGTYIYTCNEMCGTGHSAMYGYVKVVSQEAYAKFLETYKPVEATTPDAKGKKLYLANCSGCHGTKAGEIKAGPSWHGLFPKEGKAKRNVKTNGAARTVDVDYDYIARSIREPGADVVDGFANSMTPFSQLSDEDIQNIVEYMKTLND